MRVSTGIYLGLALAAMAFGAGCAKTDYSDSSTDPASHKGTSAQTASKGDVKVTIPQNPHKTLKKGADVTAALKAQGIIK